MARVAEEGTRVRDGAKPLLRGWLHEVAAIAMLAVGPLIGLEAQGTKAEVCAGVACFGYFAMLTTSALYHRVNWSPAARQRIRRADHCMIFVCISGSYTAVAGLVLPDADAVIVLSVVWAASLAGIAGRFFWMDGPRWALGLPYIVTGWVAVGALPEFLHRLGVAGFSLMVAGGLLYTVGAIVMARRSPDPWPKVFGYHEIFHTCVVAAAALHLSLIAFFVLPSLRA